MSTAVRDNPVGNRYEIHDGERLAGFSDYRLTDDRRIAFTRTETLPEFRGRGLAGRLVAGQLDDARRRGLAVLPFCPYVRKYIAEHADAYLGLVPAQDRARFGLPHPETA
ncbi:MULTISPECIES: GNAT family N-acetyltransferase [Streptomyces]|uniref:N-acetyltransferase n=2 Tax=Streptomyces TaxID=1883 RepID=A0A3R7LIH5_9ACTN|nr:MULTISPECIES: GNAT family N-acetyltransferase [Streptomyces]KNE79300.1 acetyltransferase [Streptomyces fradiae]OFA34006.1 GNAT family N-acetyltransferase [Streptomyces fradiae]PQM19704.1 N-acetyltransferase [Streptomyces xinghaiensis]RKM90692.1 N-acetyltransferase [Streptomyces xinghaiensis]RNC68550.1 N-acetyltransferase [Streptomyces xinghaiensis]